MITFKRTQMTGFTLVETMIAIAVLLSAITGPYYAAYRSLVASYEARDELTATALAQDGMEYIVGIRDSNFLYNVKNTPAVTMLQGLDGTAGTPNCNTTASGHWCQIDTSGISSPAVTPCNGSTAAGCSPLRLDNGGGLASTYRYTYSNANSSTLTRFTRSFQISPQNSTGEVTVTVTVSWDNYGPHSVTVTDIFDNWI